MPTYTTPHRYFSYTDSRYVRSDLAGEQKLNVTSGYYNLSRSDTRTTNLNRDWKSRLALGQDVSSAYNLVRQTYVPFSFSGTGFSKPIVVNTDHFARSTCRGLLAYDPGSLVFTADDNDLMAIALMRLKRKLQNQTKQVNAVVPLVELREFRGLIRGTAELAEGLVMRLLAIKARGRKTARRDASKAWLTFSFGISPMISDTKAVAESIAAYITRRDRTVKLTGTASKDWFASVAPTQRTGLFKANLEYRATVQHSLSYRYTAGFDLNLKSANNYGIDSQLGLEFGALLPTLWELTPYSWLVDYFTTVGPFLEDTFTSDVSQTRYVVRNRRYSCKVKMNGTFIPVDNTRILSSRFRGGDYTYFSFSRTPLSALPTTPLRIKSFDEVGNNAVNRLLNLTSLLLARR